MIRHLVGLTLALGVCAAAAVAEDDTADSPALDKQAFDQVEHGRYLTILGDCAPCHTAPGGMPFAGGRAIETPFGTIVAPNITPDRATGIGAWSDDEFVRAVRMGIARDGAHL